MGDHIRDLDRRREADHLHRSAGGQARQGTDRLAAHAISAAMFKTSRVEGGGARCNTKSFWVAERETGGDRRSLSVWAIRTDRREGMMGPWLTR